MHHRFGTHSLRALLALLFLAAASCFSAGATTYYVDYTAGSDGNAGTSSSLPWKTLDQVADFDAHAQKGFDPGDKILFKRGCTWEEGVSGAPLKLVSSGVAGNPIIIDAYGTETDPKPRFHARTEEDTWTRDGASNRWVSPQYSTAWHVGFVMLGDEVSNPDEGDEIGQYQLTVDDLNQNGEFTWDWDWIYDDVNEVWVLNDNTSKKVILYCDDTDGPTGEDGKWPAGVFVGVPTRAVVFSGVSYITMRNIDMRYGSEGGLKIYKGAHHITIEDCDISYGGGGATGYGYRAGDIVKITKGAHDIVVRNCTMKEAFDFGLSTEALIWADENEDPQNTDIYNILVEDCEIENCAGGLNITQPYNQPDEEDHDMWNITYRNNEIRYSGYGWALLNGAGEGLGQSGKGVGIWCLQSTSDGNTLENVLIEGNLIEGHAGSGIHLQDGTYMVRNNEVKDGTYARSDSFLACLVVHGTSSASSSGDVTGLISGNLFHSNATAGMTHINNNPTGETCKVYGNTWYNCGGTNYACIQYVNRNNGGLDFQSNIVYSDSSNDAKYLFYASPRLNGDGQGYNYTYGLDYNAWQQGSTTQKWMAIAAEATPAHTLKEYDSNNITSWNTDTGQDANSKFQDPVLADAANDDFSLGSTSPCIGTSTDPTFPELGRDIEGLTRPIGDGYDMGAYEYDVGAHSSVFAIRDASGVPYVEIYDNGDILIPVGNFSANATVAAATCGHAEFIVEADDGTPPFEVRPIFRVSPDKRVVEIAGAFDGSSTNLTPSSSEEFLVKDGSTVVVRLDNDGNLYTAGKLYIGGEEVPDS